jgi:hypothetical protein
MAALSGTCESPLERRIVAVWIRRLDVDPTQTIVALARGFPQSGLPVTFSVGTLTAVIHRLILT